MTGRLADLVPVMMLFAVMAVGAAVVTAPAWGLVAVAVPGLRRAGWFLSVPPTIQRRLVTTLIMVVTAGAVLATRPLWLWVSVTPFSYANPIFTLGDPGLVDVFAVILAVASALAGAWLSPWQLAVRPARPPGPRPGRRSFAGAAASAGTVIIGGAALASLVSAAAAIPADVTRPAFWWQAAGPPVAGHRGSFLAIALSGSDTGAATVYRAADHGQRVRPVAEIEPPAGEEFSDITALGNDQTFILTTIVPSDAPVSRSYEVRLAPGGHPGPLTPVRLPDGGDVTFSADGSKVAWVGPGRRSTEIMVLTLASGTIRAWSAPGQAADLSWAGDRDMAFMWSPPVSGGPGPAAGLRLLDTIAPGHDLLRSRPLIPASARFAGMLRLSSTEPVLISSDGAALFAVLTAPRSVPGGPRTAVVEFSARTGQPLRVLSEVRQGDASIYCGVVWADPAGRHVLSSCGSTVSRLDGGAITSWHSSIWDALYQFAS